MTAVLFSFAPLAFDEFDFTVRPAELFHVLNRRMRL